MRRFAFGIYDLVAGVFLSDLFQLFGGEPAARRMFQDVMTGDSALAKHRGDYALVYVACVDPVSGCLYDVYQGDQSLSEVGRSHPRVVLLGSFFDEAVS